MIPDRLLDMITQCENRLDELTDIERGFIMGDPKDPRKASLRTWHFLSVKQKAWLERIYKTRLLKQEVHGHKERLDYGAITATRSVTEGYTISIADFPVGQGVPRKEAAVITSWLKDALKEIQDIPIEEIHKYERDNKDDAPF